METMPIIGITCHVDTGHQDDIFPGRALNYIDRTYSDVLIANGMLPFLIPVNENEAYIEQVLSSIDGLLCTGGGKIPQYILEQREIPVLAETAPHRYRFEKVLFQRALDKDLPILGMCRGMQMMNEVLEGTMHLKITENIPDSMEHNQIKKGMELEEPYHEIQLAEGSHLKRILKQDRISVNSWHSQSIKKPGKNLIVAARSDDQVIEAIESEVNTFVLLTQFHPEILVRRDESWNRLFAEFRLQAVKVRKRKEIIA